MIFEEHELVIDEDENDNINRGFSWLPISILNDVDYKSYEEEEQREEDDIRFSSKRRSYDKRRFRPLPPPPLDRKSPAAGRFPLLTSQHSKCGLKPHPKLPKYPMAGGPGMQAIFLHSGGQKSSGTGVFFPQVTTKKDGEITKKSGFAPILLPTRVVQVLNLNVHALSAQKKSRDIDNDMKEKDDRFRNKKINKISSEISKIFLPKEWPY